MGRIKSDRKTVPHKYDIGKKSHRRIMVELVLTSMRAGGEFPSLRTQFHMNDFVDGEMNLEEVCDAILKDGRQSTDKSLAPAARAERRCAVDSALGTTLAEGVSPSDDVLVLNERYVEGEISLEDLGNLVRTPHGLPIESAEIDLKAGNALRSMGNSPLLR
jgi:Antitoxin VbhA